MVRRVLLIAILAVVAAGAVLSPGGARAQGLNDDRFFMLRDPFRRGPFSREPYAPYPSRETPPPPQIVAPLKPRYEAPAGTAYGSAVEAEAERGKAPSEYVLVVGDTLAEQLAQGLAEAFYGERPEVAVIKKVRAGSGLARALCQAHGRPVGAAKGQEDSGLRGGRAAHAKPAAFRRHDLHQRDPAGECPEGGRLLCRHLGRLRRRERRVHGHGSGARRPAPAPAHRRRRAFHQGRRA